jgi:hypothetical protein
MSLDHLGKLAKAAGYAAVPDDVFEFGRDDLVPVSASAPALRTALDHVRTPDAPAPRSSTALIVVEPMWRSQPVAPPTWTSSVTWLARDVAGRVASRVSRGLPAWHSPA